MSLPGELEKYYKDVAQKGKASFKVIFQAAPGDDGFSDHKPVADVTIVAKDPITGAEIFRTAPPWQMSTKECEFEVKIQVLDVLGVVKSTWYRLRGEAKPKPYQVTITVAPHPGYEMQYSPKDFPAEVHVGLNGPQHVWMLRDLGNP